MKWIDVKRTFFSITGLTLISRSMLYNYFSYINCTSTNCCKLQLVKNPKSPTCPNVVQLHYKTQFQFRTWFMGQTQNISESWLKIFLNLANFYVDDSWVMQHVCTDPFIAWDSMLSYEYKNLKYLMSSVSFFFGWVGRNGK